MTSRQQHATTASANDEFSLRLSTDDDGISTLKRNVAKSGILSGLSTLQRTPRSLPETIAEKEKAAELADIESSEEKGTTTTFKLPTQLIVSDSLEIIERISLGGDTDYEFEQSTYIRLPAMPYSTSNPNLQSMTLEADEQETSLYNPMFMEKDEETEF